MVLPARLSPARLALSVSRSAALGLCVAALSTLTAQSPPAAQRSPRDWAVIACNHEIESLDHQGPWLRYRTHVMDSKGDRTRLVIESQQGSVARTILRDGKPLSADEDAAERSRLQGIAASSTSFERHIKSDEEGRKLAVELIHQMPDAMIYTPVPNTDNSRGPTGELLLAFDYQPNPKWNAPSTTAEALTGLRGRVWVDPASGRVVRMTGEIFRPVNFGWGMLARLYPGGTVSVEQTEVAGSRWIYRHFQDDLRIRALMIKTVDAKTEVTASDFQALPGPLSYQQAIKLLLEAPAR